MPNVSKAGNQPPAIHIRPPGSQSTAGDEATSRQLPVTEGLSPRAQRASRDQSPMLGPADARRTRGELEGGSTAREASPYPASVDSSSSGARTAIYVGPPQRSPTRPPASEHSDQTAFGPGERLRDLGTGSMSHEEKLRMWSDRQDATETTSVQGESSRSPLLAPGDKARQKQPQTGEDRSPELEPLRPVSPRPIDEKTSPVEVLRVFHPDDENSDSDVKPTTGKSKGKGGLFGKLTSAASASASWTSRLPSLPPRPALPSMGLADSSSRMMGGVTSMARSLTDIGTSTTKSLGGVAKAMDPRDALATGWKTFESGVSKGIPKIRDPLFKVVDAQVNSMVNAMFGYKDPLAGIDLPPPEKMTYDDAARLVRHLKDFYLNNSGSPAIDLEDLKKEVAKEVFPVIKQSLVRAGTKYAADTVAGLIGTRSTPSILRRDTGSSSSSAESRTDGNESDQERWETASTRSTTSRASSARSGRTDRTDRSDRSESTSVTKQFVLDVTTQVAHTAIKRILDRSQLLNPEKQKKPHPATVIANVYDKMKEIYAPIIDKKSAQTKERIAALDTSFDIDRGYDGGPMLMSAGPLEDKVWERLELAHHNPAMKHAKEWLRSDELSKRIESFKNPDTLCEETAEGFEDLVFAKLRDPDATMLAFTLYSEQPGGGKNMHVTKLGEILNRPVIELEGRDLFAHDIWDASPGSFIARKLARAGQTDVIFHVPEYSLPYNPQDPQAAESHPNTVTFKTKIDPNCKYKDGDQEVPHHFIFVFTSQFNMDHIPAAFERAPSLELRAKTRQRNFKAKETLQRCLNAIQDETTRDRVKAMAEPRLAALGHVGDVLDCGLRNQERMTQHTLDYCRTCVESRDTPSELTHDMKLINLALRLGAPNNPAVMDRLREIRDNVQMGQSIRQQFVAAAS